MISDTHTAEQSAKSQRMERVKGKAIEREEILPAPALVCALGRSSSACSCSASMRSAASRSSSASFQSFCSLCAEDGAQRMQY